MNRTITYTTIIAVLVIRACTLAPAAHAAEERGQTQSISIGLSPFYNDADARRVREAVARFILAAPPGTAISISDAYHLETVAAFTVPRLNYDSASQRARALVQPLGALLRWFEAQRNAPAPADLKGTASLRAPEWLDQAALQPAVHPRAILIIGSPLYRSPREESFGMQDCRVPSDAHLLVGLAQSPYGTLERKNELSRAAVGWLYPSEDLWGNPLQRTLVTRFWNLFMTQLGARLAYFGPDTASAFSSLTNPPAGGESFTLDSRNTKLEMRVARPRQVPTWFPEPSTGAAGTAAGAAGAPAAATVRVAGPPAQATAAPALASGTARPREVMEPITTPVDIGIMWRSPDPAEDLDLYVRARPGAEELWFGHVRTPEGTYLHDWTQPNSEMDFEWVRLNPPVRIADIEAWVNLYRGTGPISGRVAVHFENRVYTSSFTISATSGNGGVGAGTRESNPCWTRLDVQQIFRQLPQQ